MQEAMIKRAKELLADGSVDRVIGCKRGEFVYDVTPAVFTTAEELDREFVYDDFTAANVSKYLIKETKKEGKILAFLKPCDTYSFNQLIKEHRIVRENVYVIGIPGGPKLDAEKIKAMGITGILGAKNDNGTLTNKLSEMTQLVYMSSANYNPEYPSTFEHEIFFDEQAQSKLLTNKDGTYIKGTDKDDNYSGYSFTDSQYTGTGKLTINDAGSVDGDELYLAMNTSDCNFFIDFYADGDVEADSDLIIFNDTDKNPTGKHFDNLIDLTFLQETGR